VLNSPRLAALDGTCLMANTAATTSTDITCACSSTAYSNSGTGASLVCTLKSLTCAVGTFYQAVSTPTSDAVCTSCTLGTNYRSSVTNISSTSPGALPCTVATVCPTSVAYSNTAATLIVDAVCACAVGYTPTGIQTCFNEITFNPLNSKPKREDR